MRYNQPIADTANHKPPGRALHRRLAFGTLLMGGCNALKLVLQLLALPLIARLLGPGQYGLFSLAMPVVYFLLMIADSGLGTSLAREPIKNHAVWSSAFWFLQGSALILAVGLALAAWPLAVFAGQPHLPAVIVALCPCIFMLTLAVPGNARLTQEGRVGVNSVGELIGTLVGTGIAIILAWRGAGIWSLVAQTVIIYAFRTGFIMVAAPFRPDWHFAFRDLRAHLAVGGSILGTRLADTGGRSGETAILSRLAGPSFLGAYSFANQAPRFICESVSNSLWALIYAFALQAGAASSASLRIYAAMLRLYGLIVFPAAFLLAALSPHLVPLLLGARWVPATLMLQVLLVTFALNVSGGLGGALLYAKGRSDVQFRIMVESVVLRLLCVGAEPWIGTDGLAFGLGAANLYVFLRGIFAVSHHLGISPFPYLKALAGPFLAAAVAAVGSFAIAAYAPDTLMGVVLTLACGGLFYVAALLGIERRQLWADAASLRQLLQSRNAVEPA